MVEPGTIVGGKYRLKYLVGSGAMASVWSAVHEHIGRPVAVKFIHTDRQSSSSSVSRFLREAKSAASVQHRFVIDIFDYGETQLGDPYIVMELLHGETLAHRLATEPPMPITMFLDMIAMALSGLNAAHQAGVIHRDIKPENIFLVHDDDGFFPKLVDFGISRVNQKQTNTTDASRLTTQGTILGTPYYMSPEQVRGRDSLDSRTDIYSMGVIMYEALSGTFPFTADTVGELIVKIATDNPLPLSVHKPELGEDISNLIATAMSRNPNDRFPTAAAMRQAIRDLSFDFSDFNVEVVSRPVQTSQIKRSSAELGPESEENDVDDIELDQHHKRWNKTTLPVGSAKLENVSNKRNQKIPNALLVLIAVAVIAGSVSGFYISMVSQASGRATEPNLQNDTSTITTKNSVLEDIADSGPSLAQPEDSSEFSTPRISPDASSIPLNRASQDGHVTDENEVESPSGRPDSTRQRRRRTTSRLSPAEQQKQTKSKRTHRNRRNKLPHAFNDPGF